jgi:hypothetical protein
VLYGGVVGSHSLTVTMPSIMTRRNFQIYLSSTVIVENEKMNFQTRDDFDATVDLLLTKFPDTYSSDRGHQVVSWTQCEEGLPYLKDIIEKYENHEVSFSNIQSFAELLLRCSWWVQNSDNPCNVLTNIGIFMREKTMTQHNTILRHP